jgi:adenine-specific DNA-methyltransferase
MIFYSKNKQVANFLSVVLDKKILESFNKKDQKGIFRLNNYLRSGGGDQNLRINKPNFFYPIYVNKELTDISLDKKNGYEEILPITSTGQERTWKTKSTTFLERLKNGEIIAERDKDQKIQIYEKYRENQIIKTHWIDSKYHAIHYGAKIIEDLFKLKCFDFPKSLYLLVDTLKLTTLKDDIILDFFSGSATTAHAVMQLNTEDNGNRKFVMVQLSEQTDVKSEAYKAGYKTIADIGRERIRRAGKKILEENAEKLAQREKPLDIGFRSYKVTDSIMEDVYKNPNELKQSDLLELADNIKRDKTPEDILTSVILDLGLTLDLPIKEEKIGKNIIYNVADGSLLACFDKDIDFSIIDEIAKIKPLRVVFRDASFKDDKDRINVETKFKQLSPDTSIKVL